ncbi:MAG: VOC family protein [Nitrospinota bacterium]|nr:VOC family protein [Nitrospinota bacterium]
MKLDGVHHIGLNVRDLDRAEAFYTEVLGFEVTERYAESIRHIMLASPGEPAGAAKVHLFETKDLDMQGALETISGKGYAHIAFGTTRERFPKIVEELKQKKIRFKGPLVMGQGESVHFSDPDGNSLEIRCPRDT